MLSKSDILGIHDLGEPVKLHIPEWDNDVCLRRPTANDRDHWEMYCEDHKTKPKSIWRAKLAAMLLCDESGKLLFTPAEAEKLGEKSAAALHRIWTKALELMSISDKEVAELEKN